MTPPWSFWREFEQTVVTGVHEGIRAGCHQAAGLPQSCTIIRHAEVGVRDYVLVTDSGGGPSSIDRRNRGPGRPLPEVLATGLRVHSAVGSRQVRSRRFDAGFLRASDRKTISARCRSGARTVPLVPARGHAALLVERTRSGAGPETR